MDPVCHAAAVQLVDGNATDALRAALVRPRPADESLTFAEPCNAFVVQANMSNPEEHCNLGFERLVVDEGGAVHYTVRLADAPPLGSTIQLRVSGTYLQTEPAINFTADDFDLPHEIKLLLAENLDVTGDYWMDLVHSFSLDVGGAWYTTREPAIGLADGGWTEGKLWCEATGAAFPLVIPVLVVDNDVPELWGAETAYVNSDDVLWQLQTLVQGADDTRWSRGPFPLDATFFSEWASGFWTAEMPDAAFRIDGDANGTWIYRPCPDTAPASCSTTCMWDNVVQYQNNRPTIFVSFDDPCFLEYPPAVGAGVDLYAAVRTDRADMAAVWITMERGIKWAWDPWLNVELQAPWGEWAEGYEARPLVDSGSTTTGLSVRSFVGVANRPGLDVHNSGLQFGAINAADIYLVPPPPPESWGDSMLDDDRPAVLAPPYLQTVLSPLESCTAAATPCVNGGVCTEWLWLDRQFADGYGCVCPVEYGGHFCEQLLYEEVDATTAWAPGIYNITLGARVARGGNSLRWSELVVWDTDECAIDNGGCGEVFERCAADALACICWC